MNFEEYEQRALALAVYKHQGNNLTYPTLGLAGEAGEVANKVKKIDRDLDGDLECAREALVKELGDVLWYLAACAYELDVTLEEVAEMNLLKLEGRAENGTLHGEGDER